MVKKKFGKKKKILAKKNFVQKKFLVKKNLVKKKILTKKIYIFLKIHNLKFKFQSLKFNFFKNLNFQKVRNFILYKKSFKWSCILKNKVFKLMSEKVSKKDWKKKTEKKSGKKPQSKPYIVTHWHATLNLDNTFKNTSL